MNTENNKIIAEFMGYILRGVNTYEYNNKLHLIEDLKFHSDWNWLMEVVEKINELGYEVLIGRISCQINEMLKRENPISAMVCGDISKKIEITYDAVVQFIEWHNIK